MMSRKISLIQYLPLTHTRATFRLLSKLQKSRIQTILDLEDSAQDPFSKEETIKLKAKARCDLIEYISSERFQKQRFDANPFIRINASSSDFFNDDIELVNKLDQCHFPLKGIFLPKCESSQQIQNLSDHIPETVKIIPMIETVLGYQNAEEIISSNVVEEIHYGHFDYALDSQQWPFLDPVHNEYWGIIDDLVNLCSNFNKTYIHTPFPFMNDKNLFWAMVAFMQRRYKETKIIYCTLNSELSFSNSVDDSIGLNFINYPTEKTILTHLANEIISSYEQGRANKRSFGTSVDRFIPPHQYFAAKNFLQSFESLGD